MTVSVREGFVHWTDAFNAHDMDELRRGRGRRRRRCGAPGCEPSGTGRSSNSSAAGSARSRMRRSRFTTSTSSITSRSRKARSAEVTTRAPDSTGDPRAVRASVDLIWTGLVRFTLVRGDVEEGHGPVADLQLARDELERQDIAALPLGRPSPTPRGCDCTGRFELSRAPSTLACRQSGYSIGAGPRGEGAAGYRLDVRFLRGR